MSRNLNPGDLDAQRPPSHAASVDDRQILERALRSSARKTGCIGFGVLALGAFMIALHAARLDPSAAKMSTAGVVALYFFGVLFVFTGLAGIYVALVKSASQARAILHALDTDPSAIERIESFVIKTQGAENLPGGQHGVRFFLRGSPMWQVLTSKDDVEPIVRYVRSRAPHAVPKVA
jgi:hypothetical protein